ELLDFLMAGLPIEYAIVCQALDAQPSLQTHEKLNLLRNAQVSQQQHALVSTDDKSFPQPGPGNHKSKPKDQPCVFCDGTHSISDCEIRSSLLEMATSFQRKKKRRSEREEEHGGSERRRSVSLEES
ncbi:hypothetical protein EG329_004571, partial [Mollisiaceae sp. DMI_Dod_QoI]